MKQCPRCRREYPDDLNFCLEDGSPLIAKGDDNKTWVMPGPEPVATITAVGAQIEPGPTVATPTPQRNRTRRVLTTIGIIVGVSLYALIKIAPWSERWQTSGGNTNSAPISYNFAPSATPTATVSGAPADSSSPSSSSPSPSPVPEVSLVRVIPQESNDGVIAPGSYGTSFQPKNRPEDALGLRTIRLVINLNADGTYSIEAYYTLHGTDVNDRLYREEKGRYSQTRDQLLWRERIVRQFDYDNEVWKPWAVPDSGVTGADSIQNVTTTSFQLYSNDSWLTVRRLY